MSLRLRHHQREFLDLAIKIDALRFGKFRLKSGRESPYFFNAGMFDTGASLAALGGYYARSIVDAKIDYDMLFGPAYKGIPLVAATAAALAEKHERDVPFAFNRKEAKDHGEGGSIVGASLTGRVLIIDDVITAGTAIGEAVNIIRAAGARPSGVFVALDRQERGRDELSAIQQVQLEHNIEVESIVRLDDLIEHLADRPKTNRWLAAVRDYRDRYGV